MLNYIHRGSIYEANFCMEFFAENAAINPLEIFNKLNAISETPFATFFKNNTNFLMSASPERYLKKQVLAVISQPIKGTARRSQNQIEDNLLKANESGEMEEVVETNKYKVYQRIFLSLQEDETELANPLFKSIYNDLIQYFQQNDSFEMEQYLNQIPTEIAQEVTSILMNDEQEVLGNWEAKNIFVKQKEETISQNVTETILSLRWFLVDKIVEELKGTILQGESQDNSETLMLVNDYNGLKNMFSKKLGRVISRHN